MSGKNNSTCSICGEPYYLCISCKEKMAAAPWKMHCDTAEHYKVYQIINGYSAGIYSKDEAKKRFEKVDLSDMDKFREHIRATIEDILGAPAKTNDEDNGENVENDSKSEETYKSSGTDSNKKQTQFVHNKGRRR